MLETIYVHTVIEQLLKEKAVQWFCQSFLLFFFYASFLSIYNFS